MPYFPVNDNEMVRTYFFTDNNNKLMGYTYCHDIALHISRETGWKYHTICKHHKIKENMPIYDWSIEEPEIVSDCCFL